MELPPVVVDTPAPITTITPVIKRRWLNRLVALTITALAGLYALLQQLVGFNFQSLGFSPVEAAWIAFAIFIGQFVLLQFFTSFRADVKAEPGNQT